MIQKLQSIKVVLFIVLAGIFHNRHPEHKVIFTVPKMQRLLLRYKRILLSPLSRAAVQALLTCFHALTGLELMPRVVAVIEGEFHERALFLKFPTSMYSNTHRGKMSKIGASFSSPISLKNQNMSPPWAGPR